MAKKGKEPEFVKGLEKFAEDAADEMSKMKDNLKLSLSADEIKSILQMEETDLLVFLSQKGIDFAKPVLLVTPNGTAEPWMYSAKDIKDFLRRCYGD